ncbi:hypothetical protein PENTCL1PPCAC_23997, partial [Pristionchus entomophagus]
CSPLRATVHEGIDRAARVWSSVAVRDAAAAARMPVRAVAVAHARSSLSGLYTSSSLATAGCSSCRTIIIIISDSCSREESCMG